MKNSTRTVPQHETSPATPDRATASVSSALTDLGIIGAQRGHLVERLPFGPDDVTAGVENELQTAIIGPHDCVDLPRTLAGSSYFQALAQGDGDPATQACRRDLHDYLHGNAHGVWENSWVRLPYQHLNAAAQATVAHDLLADKDLPDRGPRRDAGAFLLQQNGETILRVPVSYLHKLALSDALGADPALPATLRDFGNGLLNHFTNDNTAPEQFSSYVMPLNRQRGMGRAVARETAQRFLLTQLLDAYANEKFQLASSGQRSTSYFAPHTPLGQKRVGRNLPDELYRELFMNPCLSGWNEGEKKYRYMHLCHQTLTTSRRLARLRVRESGISLRGGDSLDFATDTSLANNGTHVSLGSRLLTRHFREAASGAAQEKALGDLAIKITEYFLPLFVGNYSAAPYRLNVGEFRAENALGFLPHQLNDAYLRQLWRQWRKKARRQPSGSSWWSKAKGRVLGLQGDYVRDIRLLDYFVALPSGVGRPMLDGRLGNSTHAIQALERQHVYSSAMTLYLPYRLREVGRMGFSGFEGRYYSAFESLSDDLGRSAELQLLITALAYQYMAQGTCSAADIPDDRNSESERRQFFFASAAGVPVCYIRRDNLSPFLARILRHAQRVRPSNRHPAYLKVPVVEYQRALLFLLQTDGRELIELHGLQDTVKDLARRLEQPDEAGCAGRMQRDILADLGTNHPMETSANEFNQATERYYREHLRAKHVREAIDFLRADVEAMNSGAGLYAGALRAETRFVIQGAGGAAPLHAMDNELLDGRMDTRTIVRAIQLLLLAIRHDALQSNHH
jgi:hypothetical protein